jgi:hypothetical protein
MRGGIGTTSTRPLPADSTLADRSEVFHKNVNYSCCDSLLHSAPICFATCAAALEGEGDMQNPFRRIKDPVEGRMHVLTCTAINPDVMRSPCHVTYLVRVEGVAAFAGERVFELWCMQWLNPGDDLPVVFDRTRNDRIRIQWHRIPTHAESAPPQMSIRPLVVDSRLAGEETTSPRTGE